MQPTPLALALALVSYPLRLATYRSGAGATTTPARVVVISTSDPR